MLPLKAFRFSLLPGEELGIGDGRIFNGQGKTIHMGNLIGKSCGMVCPMVVFSLMVPVIK